MLYYCKKCGRLMQRDKGDNLNEPCDYCFSRLYPIPDEYLGGKNKCFIKSGLKEQFIDEYIKSSPEFDQNLFDHRDEDLYKRRMEDRAKLEHGKAILEGKNSIACSYCGSTNISKIGFFNRLGSAELWGLGSDKIGKQFHCNNCGANF